MSRVAKDFSGKRPQFFPESGADQIFSMMLELMSEVWTLRQRMYALERVAAEQGVELTAGIDAWQPDAAEAEKLNAERQEFIASVMRSLEANSVPGRHLRRSLDEAAQQDEDGELLTDAARAA